MAERETKSSDDLDFTIKKVGICRFSAKIVMGYILIEDLKIMLLYIMCEWVIWT